VINASGTQIQTKQLEPAAPRKKSSQKSILAWTVFALGLNASAAVYTLAPSDFALPNVGGLVAELLPHDRAPAPIPDAVVATLNHIRSGQQYNANALQDNQTSLQQNAALLQQNGSLLQQNTGLLQQDTIKLDALRSSLTDEQSDVKTVQSDVRTVQSDVKTVQSDVKTIATQLSTLIAKVDSLPKAMSSEITSSIPKERAGRLSGVPRKRLAHRTKPERSISVGAAPLAIPSASGPSHSPAG